MTIEKIFPSGGYLISDIIDGQYVKHRYFGYTKREAMAIFKNEHLAAYREERKRELSRKR